MPRLPASTSIILTITTLALFCSGCARLGPRSIRGDRFNYNKAGAQSANEQVLLNIVRLRYGEPIYFLDIASMLSQYTLQAGANFSAWKNNLDVWENPALRAVYNVDSDPSSQRQWGADVAYTDRPTITYTPLEGEAFAQRVMSPIPPSTIIYLSESGWGMDQLFECCVQEINGVKNAPIHDITEADYWDTLKFRTVAKLLRRVQDAGQLHMEVEVDPETKDMYLYTGEVTGFEEEARELRELLGLPTEKVSKVKIEAGGIRDEENEVIMRTRSILGMLNALAQAIDPPADHVENGEILVTAPKEGAAVTETWLRVDHSRTPSSEAFVQVYYNGYWWYIRRSDWNSKRTFALIAYLFSLQASERATQGPLVTVGAGGS
ncbi:MAG: hypothetical protein JSV78_13940 [Phycisphaerales bacterium]|nr:MAG: hypothetical protein JSV78_13940 [Phycisphaerales bacterium]